jgi:hypothetical protein
MSASRYVLIINQQDTIHRSAVTSNPKPGTSSPPGLKGVDPAYLVWPTAPTLKASWSVFE